MRSLIFSTAESAPGVYDDFFWGIFHGSLWVPIYAKALWAGLVILGFGFAITSFWKPRRSFSILSLCSTLLGFGVLCFLFCYPKDEIFIHLRHSLHLAETGSFSFSRLSKVEGIVEFLPFVLIGFLHKLGLPLLELAVIQSALGSFLCLFAFLFLAKQLKISEGWICLDLAALSLVHPLAFNAGHGFGNALCTAFIVWSLVLLFYSPYKKTGFLVLSLIPLIRWEGGFILGLIFLLLAYETLKQDRSRRSVVALVKKGSLILLPTIMVTLYRFIEFGRFVPIPVQYKTGIGNWGYFKAGMDKLWGDLLGGHALLFVLIFAALLFISRKKISLSPLIRKLLLTTAPVVLLVANYYPSGGDWFPYFWGRYLLPFTVWVSMVTLSLLALLWSRYSELRYRIAGSVCVMVIATLFLPQNGFSLMVSELRNWEAGRANFRIHQLSQLGWHLGRTTREKDVIASAEVATTMFYARREVLDLLGIINSEVSTAPLVGNGSVSYRRRNPALIEKYKPGIVYGLGWRAVHPQGTILSEVTSNLFVTRRKFAVDNNFRFGGIENLSSLGYRLVTVWYSDAFSASYFVSPELFPYHISELNRLGFQKIYEGLLKTRHDIS